MMNPAATVPTLEPIKQIEAILRASGIPAKEIRCYGSQIMVTAWSQTAARKWFRLLHGFAETVRQPTLTTDYNKVNKNTCLVPTVHKVWRVWATI
jgi:hypothetical protein